MRKIKLDVELVLNDDVADYVESLDNLSLELAAYFKIKHDGGVVFSPESLTGIINDMLDEYGETTDDDAVLTDKDIAGIEVVVSNLLNEALGSVVIGNKDNVVVNSEDEYEEDADIDDHSTVEVFGTLTDGEECDGEIDEDGLDALGDMFGF